MAKPKNKGGAGNKTPIDLEKVEQYAALRLNKQEIAQLIGILPQALSRRMRTEPEIQQAIDRGMLRSNVSIARTMFEKAMAGDNTMLIWLSKNWMHYSDKVEAKHQVEEMSGRDRLTDIVDSLMAREEAGKVDPGPH